MERDIGTRQNGDELNFYTFYYNGPAGFYDAGSVDFNSVTNAAETGYHTEMKRCRVGHTYVVKTYESNYAKFVVKSISEE